jgi:hypothetical protein
MQNRISGTLQSVLNFLFSLKAAALTRLCLKGLGFFAATFTTVRTTHAPLDFHGTSSFFRRPTFIGFDF